MKRWQVFRDRYVSYNTRILLVVISMMGGSLVVSGFAFWILYLGCEIALEWNGKNAYFIGGMVVSGALMLLSEAIPFGRGKKRGISIGAAEHPDLFARIEKAARAAGRRVPAEVCLSLDIRAWAQRTGPVGLGRQWRLTIGLPLLQMLSVSELDAVLRHELQQSRRWIHTLFVRMAVESDYFPGDDLGFFGYFEPARRDMFVRLTYLFGLTGYAQELAADKKMNAALPVDERTQMMEKLSRSSAAIGGYIADDVKPMISAGYVPPISSGLQMKLAYDSMGEVASSLVSDVHSLEREILWSPHRSSSPPLKPVAWPDVAEQVSIPRWRRIAEKASEALEGFQLRHVYPALTDPLHFLSARLKSPEDNTQSLNRYTQSVVEAALAVHLLHCGWTVISGPGVCWFQYRELGFDLRQAMHQIVSGEITIGQWESQLTAIGLDLCTPIRDRAGC